MNIDVIATPSVTDNIIKRYNLRLNHGMGQNFLIDQNIVKKIIAASDIKEDDTIIEIGPGIGSLTQFLLNEVKEGRYIALEKDDKLNKVLQEIFAHYNNTCFLNEDALEIDWKSFFKKRDLETEDIKIIANLPYYITSTLIIKLLKLNLKISRMIFMVQKEVAERMVADPGSKIFGSLSIAVQFYSHAYKIFDVPPTVFRPRPDVYSSIICLEPYDEVPYNVKDRDLFFAIVRGIFQQRRKKIKNSLIKASTINFTREEVLKGLKDSSINPDIRGEKLEINKMVQLSNALYKVYIKN